MERIVLGVSGASGMALAEVVMRAFRQANIEVHLILSHGAEEVLRAEGAGQESADTSTIAATAPHSAGPEGTPPLSKDALISLAHHVHAPSDLAAGPASGSWQHKGMIVCPCSMASLAAIASGAGQNLLHRAADVSLKERRPLVLVPRETPLSRIHLRNMLAAQEAGAVIMPFCPAFYAKPQSINDLLEHMAGRLLDQLAIPHNMGHRWKS